MRISALKEQLIFLRKLKMIKITVVIPTYDEEKYIEKCLKSLTNQTFNRNDYEIVVVDANSRDKTVEIAKKYADKIFVVNKKGIAYGRFFGIKKSRGKLIYTTDADCRAPKKLLQNFYDRFIYLNKRKKVVALSGITKFQRFRGKLLEEWYYIYGKFISPIQFGTVSLNGQNSLIKKSAILRSISGKKLPLFMDDNFFSIHLRKFGDIIFSKLQELANYGSERRIKNLNFAVRSLCRYLIAMSELKKYGTVSIEQIR